VKRISDEKNCPLKLWKSLSKILRREDNTAVSSHTADDFIMFFNNKVESVRASTADAAPPVTSQPVTSSLTDFPVCSEDEVRRVIMSSPTKSCTLDPIPTDLLKESVDVLLPYLTAMVNASLREGCLPASQKIAIITPLLKKPSLDTSELKNYRPVSNLSFMSKVIEKVVAAHLTKYLQENDLLPRLQSAYRRHHSTETALLRVLSDIYAAADRQDVTLLGLLDLSAAFDCVDHDILISRLQQSFGIRGTTLSWITSFLHGRTQQVFYAGGLSVIMSLAFGVPQGSVLGPLLFLLYTAELFRIVASAGLTAHSYADDTQLYISAPAASASTTVQRFVSCVERIDEWMSSNRLKMNADKTQLLWLGTRQQLDKLTVTDLQLLSARVSFSTTVSDLGVLIDSQLSMSDYVASRCRSCFFQLRQLRQVRSSLTEEATKTLVHAFISSRLDYCNSLLYGVNDGLLKKLQIVHNAAARVVTGVRKFDHISPVLRELHWLPVRHRITYKLATIVYKCLHGLAPSYLADDCVPVTTVAGRRHLRSADSRCLVVPRTRTALGTRNFAVAGPLVWNSLPANLRSASVSLRTFAGKLKTYLFQLP